MMARQPIYSWVALSCHGSLPFQTQGKAKCDVIRQEFKHSDVRASFSFVDTFLSNNLLSGYIVMSYMPKLSISAVHCRIS